MRWRDLDGLGHVNHTVVLTYLEEGRDAFLHGARDPPRRVRRRALLGRASTARSTRPSARSRVAVRGRRARQQERAHERADPRRRAARRWSRREFGARPLGPGAAGLAADHRRRSARRSPAPEEARERRDERLERDPVVVTCAITGADVFRENNPNIPYTTEEIAELDDRGGGRGRHRRPPARARGRRHPERSPGAVRRRDRPDPRRLRRADDGLDRRRQRHDDRGADHRARGEARHLRGRVGLDELRRRDLHHPAAGRARDRRAGDRRSGSRSRSSASTSATWSARCAGSSRGSSTAPMRINLVFGVPGGIDATPEALDAMLRPLPPETLLDRHLHRPPPPADARRWRCSRARRGSAPGSRTSPTSPRACSRRRTRRWSRWRSGSRGTLGREVATQEQTKELLELG